MNIIRCIKLNQDLPALERAPYPGELGRKILEQVSSDAWQLWLTHQTMLINENHLSMIDPKAQKFLKEQLEQFFFGDGGAKIQGYTPEK